MGIFRPRLMRWTKPRMLLWCQQSCCSSFLCHNYLSSSQDFCSWNSLLQFWILIWCTSGFATYWVLWDGLLFWESSVCKWPREACLVYLELSCRLLWTNYFGVFMQGHLQCSLLSRSVNFKPDTKPQISSYTGYVCELLSEIFIHS